jgi:hypothetical protein
VAGIHKITYKNPMGVKLMERLPISSFNLQRRTNEIGSLSMVVANPAAFPVGYFAEDGQIEVWRSVNGLPYYLEGETSWFINRVRHATDDTGQEVLELQAADATCLLGRRVVAYDNGSTYTSKLGFADDEIVDILTENYGVSAIDATRDLSTYLAIQAALSAGAIVGDDIGWKRVIDVLKNFADASDENGARIIYDIVSDGRGGFTFRTWSQYRGMDHSSDSSDPVVVSQNRRNLKSPEIIFDYTDAYNYVYMGGKGESSWHPVEEASDAARIGKSPFARRELYVNASNVSDPDKLTALASAYLRKGRPRILFNGAILDTPGAAYGVRFHYGDLVTAEYKGFAIDCVIDSLRISYDRDNGEQLEIRLKGESYV